MNQNNKFFSLLLILFAFIVLVVFTKGQLYNLQGNLDLKASTQGEYDQTKAELTKLEALKKALNSGENGEVNKYLEGFKEDELSEYLYTYVQDTNGQNGVIVIRSLSLSEGKINEYGFHEGTVTIEARVSDEDTMIGFLDFLVSDESKYSFFIDSFNYANPGNASFSVTIPLKVFYK